MTYTEEEKARLRLVKEAIEGLEGISIRFDVIKNYMVPFAKWLDYALADEADKGVEGS